MATESSVRNRGPGTGKAPRCIAVVGPFQSGKTTLLEAVLARMGALQRQGSVVAGTSIGDGCDEARSHRISVEMNVASVDFLGDPYTFIDCPGSVEFLAEMLPVLPVVDAAVVVCDADDKKVSALQVVLRDLEARRIPRLLFLNKIDATATRIGDAVSMLQPASRAPLMLRQIPIIENGTAVGFIDLALERAFLYRDHAPSCVVAMPDDAVAEEKAARFSMLERLSDHDDHLMAELVEEVEPERGRVFDDLAHEVQDGLAVPVLIGSALHGNGIGRLMKALRHEIPDFGNAARRLDIEPQGEALAQVIKTLHTAHAGKLSVARILRGPLKEGTIVTTTAGQSARIAGLVRLMGQTTQKVAEAQTGETVALGRLEMAQTGDTLAAGKPAAAVVDLAQPPPVMAVAIRPRERKDDVKLGAALRKLAEEDRSLGVEHPQDRSDLVLFGQGDMHLRVAVERLMSKFGIAVDTDRPQVGYRETIRKSVTGIRGRHKKQSGGHGQFGDIVIDLAPLARGEGVAFDDRIVGGAVPRQYIPSVEDGVRASLHRGPLGCPVVDVRITLTDGSHHSVDSSDMAFQQAARIAMSEALPRCHPVLLEPVLALEIAVPAEATSKVNSIVSSRRGQILGFDARAGWDGWDCVSALIPEAEMPGLIVELRSVTAGVGTFAAKFDHLAELVGREGDQVAAALQQKARPSTPLHRS